MIKYGILLSAAVVMLSASAAAGPSEAMAFAIGQCSAEPDAKARLACYDGLATQLKTGIPLPTAPAGSAPVAQAPVAPPPVAQVQPPAAQTPPSMPQPARVASAPPPAPPAQGGTWYDPTSWFGKDTPARTSNNPADFGAEAVRNPQVASAPAEPQPLQQIRSEVKAIAFAPTGRFIATLANGQVWRQIDGDSGALRISKSKQYVATIARGAFGSYNFSLDDGGMLFKVKRVK